MATLSSEEEIQTEGFLFTILRVFLQFVYFAFSAFSGRRRSERGRSDSLATSIVNEKVPSSLRSLNHLFSYILLIRRKKSIRQKKFPSQTKKVRLGFRGFRTCFWEVDHPLCDVWNILIGAQVFEKAKIYKPTWTKFWAKRVSKFSPSQKHVHLTGYFKHHTGGGQLSKNMCEIL